MPTYITLLRGINVAGQKLIKMDELRRCFEEMKFKNVSTYIQSGNVIFESTKSDIGKIESIIEKGLKKSLGHEIQVFLRTVEEIKKIVKANPFKDIKTHPESKMFVTFTSVPVNPKPKTPLWSDKKDVQVLDVFGREFFCLSHDVKGRFGFPNLFVEKTYKVAATTRNWRTVNKLVENFNE